MMLSFIEGLVFSFLVLLVCVIGIANGPENMVFFYEKEVRQRVVEMKLITEEKISFHEMLFKITIIPCFVFIIYAVYKINGTRGFLKGFIQLLIIFMTEGLFDRLFIDWYWVGHTKAWNIPRTDDLKPYINKKTMQRKWLGTLVGYPILAAIIAAIMTLLLK